MRRIATFNEANLLAPAGRVLVHIGKAVLLSPLLLVFACSPQLRTFHVTIPANPPSADADIAQKQGTTHICSGTKIQLAWQVKGKASLSTASGQIYQEPLCATARHVPAEGHELVGSNPQIASSCGNEAIFRLTASKDFWHWSGSCPGTGCPSADHEVVLEPQPGQPLGGKPEACAGTAFEVTTLRPAIDWDDHVRIGAVSVTGSTKQALTNSTRMLTVSHEGKTASFSAGALTSHAFRGEKMSGTWTLRLSTCDSPPAVLAVVAETKCSQ